jgi:hypothetical protein
MTRSPDEERTIDGWLLQDALAEMRAHPVRMLSSRMMHAVYFFWPRLVPAYDTTPETRLVLEPGNRARVEGARRRPVRDEMAYSASYVAIVVAAVVGFWSRRRQWRADLPLSCIVLTLVVTHAIFFPATRYRVPMEFVLLLYAGVAVDAWVQRSDARAGRLSSAQLA